VYPPGPAFQRRPLLETSTTRSPGRYTLLHVPPFPADPQVSSIALMASLRSLAISLLRLDGQDNIAAANRHHLRDPQRTLKLLQAA
jgi:hypothetical protein